MTFKPARLLLALIAVTAAPAFAQNLAVVNGKPIPSSRADSLVKSLVAQGQGTDSPQLREEIKRGLIANEVLAQEAARLGYDKKPEVRQEIDETRNEILLSEFARAYVAKNPPSEAETKARFNELKTFFGDKEFSLRTLPFETEAAAKDAIAKLKGGAKFEDVAKSTKAPAGSTEAAWVDPTKLGQLAQPLGKVAKGGVYETPVPVQGAFLVLKVEDTRPYKFEYDTVKPALQREMSVEKFAQYRDSLVKKAKIQ